MTVDAYGYILPAAFLLDLILGDPVHLPHPIRWMGKAINGLEPVFRKIPAAPLFSGTLFAITLISGIWLFTAAVILVAGSLQQMLGTVVQVVCVYYCISARSLEDAAMQIHDHLVGQRIDEARAEVALIVGRDVADYGPRDIARATVESVAENFVDGVLAPLLFAALGGAPLAMAYKMANTLDSMVGYKNEKYLWFGKAAARIDDGLNFLPARLSIPLIALAARLICGSGRRSLRTAMDEGVNHSSPNAGYPEAAFAGALAVRLNGPNYYDGKLVDKPYIGERFGPTTPVHIKKACHIMMLSSFFWLLAVWVARALL